MLVWIAIVGVGAIGDTPEVDPTDANSAIGFWEFITFSAVGDTIAIPIALSLVLFVTCTVPWLFIVAAILIEAIKALGGLIPFT